jgi:hypothetical protein
MSPRDRLAAREGRYLYRWLVGGRPPADLVEQYVRAVKSCRTGTERQLPDISGYVRWNLDAEAAEIYLRRPPFCELRDRAQILLYLLEGRPEYAHLFAPRQAGRPAAAWTLLRALLRTIYKRAKGYWLMRRYGRHL